MTEPRVFADGVETFLGVRDALERVEARLAAELKVPFRGIRKYLYARTMDASLVETELVREWIRRYAAYADWVDDGHPRPCRRRARESPREGRREGVRGRSS